MRDSQTVEPKLAVFECLCGKYGYLPKCVEKRECALRTGFALSRYNLLSLSRKDSLDKDSWTKMVTGLYDNEVYVCMSICIYLVRSEVYERVMAVVSRWPQ